MPADPPLVAHGVRQSVETGEYFGEDLAALAKEDRLRIYSSLFYRCLQTLRPTVEKLRSINPKLTVRGERGIGEWFGKAWFEQPAPAQPAMLRTEFFPFLDDQYRSLVIPSQMGERMQELHDRVARALEAVIQDVDEEYEAAGRGAEEVTLLLCGHAAQIICTGRVLTGLMPEDPDTDDFKCFTCGISRFVRRNKKQDKSTAETVASWRLSGGVGGGWDCVQNSWCGHLTQGEERGWHFQGDESFDSYRSGSGGIIIDSGSVDDNIHNEVSKTAPKL